MIKKALQCRAFFIFKRRKILRLYMMMTNVSDDNDYYSKNILGQNTLHHNSFIVFESINDVEIYAI